MAYNSPKYLGRRFFQAAYFQLPVGSGPVVPVLPPMNRNDGGGGNMSTHSRRQYKDTGRKSDIPGNRRQNQQIVEFVMHFSENCLYSRRW